MDETKERKRVRVVSERAHILKVRKTLSSVIAIAGQGYARLLLCKLRLSLIVDGNSYTLLDRPTLLVTLPLRFNSSIVVIELGG